AHRDPIALDGGADRFVFACDDEAQLRELRLERLGSRTRRRFAFGLASPLCVLLGLFEARPSARRSAELLLAMGEPEQRAETEIEPETLLQKRDGLVALAVVEQRFRFDEQRLCRRLGVRGYLCRVRWRGCLGVACAWQQQGRKEDQDRDARV